MASASPKNNDPAKKAIASANACMDSCRESINYCMELGGRHAEPEHIAVLMDCARICETSADFMSRQSRFHGDVCMLCAYICEECTRSCSIFAGDEQMKECALKCTACADSCREMTKLRKAA